MLSIKLSSVYALIYTSLILEMGNTMYLWVPSLKKNRTIIDIIRMPASKH